MDVLSDSCSVKYDDSLKCILILHQDAIGFPQPLVRIREETYAEMSFNQLSSFLGSRLLLLLTFR